VLGFAAALLILQTPSPDAWTARLPPVDECGADAEFARFRAALLDVLARRDVEGLRTMVAEDVFFSFGGSEGREDFFRDWRLDAPESSALWHTLAETLMLGCAREDARMVAPYSFARWPEFDGVGVSFLARPGAELRPRPSLDGEPLEILAWHVVEDASGPGNGGDGAWRRVRLADGRTGFVQERDLRSDIDYRAIFERRSGRWMLATFVAGD